MFDFIFFCFEKHEKHRKKRIKTVSENTKMMISKAVFENSFKKHEPMFTMLVHFSFFSFNCGCMPLEKILDWQLIYI